MIQWLIILLFEALLLGFVGYLVFRPEKQPVGQTNANVQVKMAVTSAVNPQINSPLSSQISSTVATNQIVSPPHAMSLLLKCSDGTAYSQCSAVKPKYCDNGNLVDNATACGCGAGYKVSDNECLSLPHASGTVVLKENTPDEFFQPGDASSSSYAINLDAIAKTFYATYGDYYDFLVFVPTKPISSDESVLVNPDVRVV